MDTRPDLVTNMLLAEESIGPFGMMIGGLTSGSDGIRVDIFTEVYLNVALVAVIALGGVVPVL